MSLISMFSYFLDSVAVLQKLRRFLRTMFRTEISEESLQSGNTEASSRRKAMQACCLAGIPRERGYIPRPVPILS